jgi:hypothetical protein
MSCDPFDVDAANGLDACWLGLLAGTVHALTGPDHVAGVAPFATTRGSRAWRVGVAWGLGHASGAAVAAVIALALRRWIPGAEEHLSAVSERLVGIVLCVVGAMGLRACRRAGHTHEHDGFVHVHLFSNRRAGMSRPRRASAAPFVIGLLHGSAGLSHVFAILPALALPGFESPALYLAAYGAGCLLAITGFAGVIGRAARSPTRVRACLGVTSAASFAVGLVWIVHPL